MKVKLFWRWKSLNNIQNSRYKICISTAIANVLKLKKVKDGNKSIINMKLEEHRINQ